VTKVGAVVVDCNDFDAMAAFWQEALQYVPREPAEDGWVVLCDPEGTGVNVSLQRVPEKASGKNRLHFDLYTEDLEGEVERLVRLGATRPDRERQPGEDFIALLDPDGNVFDVVDKSDSYIAAHSDG
jgi:hypothetical protein